MRVLVLVCLALLRCGAVFALCDGGLCSCERTWGRLNCSCNSPYNKELTLNSSVIMDGTSAIRIENCSSVHVMPRTWESHRDMRLIELFNIGELIIESNGFSWNETFALESVPPSGLTVNIFNCSIPEIPSYAFKGRLTSITLHNVSIGTIRAFAFASLYNTEKLELKESVITAFEAQAFKKFSVEKLHITGGYFTGTLPSRVMVDLEVHHVLSIEKVNINTIRSSAFVIHGPKMFRLRDNRISVLEGEAFRVKTHGKTFIQNNIFLSLAKGAFVDITVEHLIIKLKGLQELRFYNNTIEHFENGCLLFHRSFQPQLDLIFLNQTCSCTLLHSWTSLLRTPQSEERQQKLPLETDEPFWCQQDETGIDGRSYIQFQEFSQHCAIVSGLYLFLIIIVSSSLVLLVIILLVILWCRRRRSRNQRRWISVPTSTNNDKVKPKSKGKNVQNKNQNGQDSRITMIVPDGRTYRETELHVIVERTEPIMEPDYVDTAVNEREKKNQQKNLHLNPTETDF